MNRANPKDLRKSIEAAHTYMKAGILFVAVPVLDAHDHLELIKMANERLSVMVDRAEAEEAKP